MTTAYRVGGFVVALIAVFAITFGVGRAVGPWSEDTPPTHPGTHQHHELPVHTE